MHTNTALRLLGPLASLAVQRRYIARGTRDNYMLLTEVLDNGHYFLRHPHLGGAALLQSVKQFAGVLNESASKVPLDDTAVGTRAIVEADRNWNRIRCAAQAVLREIGADLDKWERKELEACDA